MAEYGTKAFSTPLVFFFSSGLRCRALGILEGLEIDYRL